MEEDKVLYEGLVLKVKNYDDEYSNIQSIINKELGNNQLTNSSKEKVLDNFNPIDTLMEESKFEFPNYQSSNYTEDIVNWRRQIDPLAGAGFFYFRVFFNFDTGYGLLGDKGENNNSAAQYLNYCNSDHLKIYESQKIGERLKALEKFKSMLYYISEKTPWIFKQVNGLNNLKSAYITEDTLKTQSINLLCGLETTDMRLSTLFDLYKFACYDNIRNKEIIPANLRKFEMSIMLFHMPLRKYNIERDEDNYYKIPKDNSVLNFTNFKNIMSFKMFTFQNCEFDVNSMSVFNEDLNNEKPFFLGQNALTINFDRVYEHKFNEYDYILVGPDGYKTIEDFKVSNTLDEKFTKIAETIRANADQPSYTGYYIAGENLYNNKTNIHSKYYVDKTRYLKDGTIEEGNIYNANYGRIGIGTLRTNTPYLDEKLRRIKEGGNLSNIPEGLAEQNSLKLSWNASVIKNSGNLYNVEGVQSKANTWFGRLMEASYQRTKAALGF